MNSSLINTISEKIKENEIVVEYTVILTVESSLAIFVIYNMYSLLISMIS